MRRANGAPLKRAAVGGLAVSISGTKTSEAQKTANDYNDR
jgi:hypothetical protein